MRHADNKRIVQLKALDRARIPEDVVILDLTSSHIRCLRNYSLLQSPRPGTPFTRTFPVDHTVKISTFSTFVTCTSPSPLDHMIAYQVLVLCPCNSTSRDFVTGIYAL